MSRTDVLHVIHTLEKLGTLLPSVPTLLEQLQHRLSQDDQMHILLKLSDVLGRTNDLHSFTPALIARASALGQNNTMLVLMNMAQWIKKEDFEATGQLTAALLATLDRVDTAAAKNE